jgi:glycosyltransferase involved in cell wall biosynthesis
MLLRIAEALVSLEHRVTVMAPSQPDDVAHAAEALGLRTIRLPAHDRLSWMRSLRDWDRRRRDGVLWCNGLVPAAATTGHPDRIVHLHQAPLSRQQRTATALARVGASATLVPSRYVRGLVPGSSVLANWSEAIEPTRPPVVGTTTFTIGFLGRLSPDKGVLTLLDAVERLDAREPGGFRLLLAGEPRFVSRRDYDVVEKAVDAISHLVDRPGWMARDEFFGRVDALAVPSLCQESFGLVAVEAMAARVPVVVSDAGALPEVVGRGGLVVPAGDSKALAGGLESLGSNEAGGKADLLHDRWARLYSPAAGREQVDALLTRLGVRARHPLADRPAPARSAVRSR